MGVLQPSATAAEQQHFSCHTHATTDAAVLVLLHTCCGLPGLCHHAMGLCQHAAALCHHAVGFGLLRYCPAPTASVHFCAAGAARFSFRGGGVDRAPKKWGGSEKKGSIDRHHSH